MKEYTDRYTKIAASVTKPAVMFLGYSTIADIGDHILLTAPTKAALRRAWKVIMLAHKFDETRVQEIAIVQRKSLSKVVAKTKGAVPRVRGDEG